MAGPTGTLGTIATLTVGGATFADTANTKQYTALISSPSTNVFSSFYAMYTTTGYTVTALKTLKLRAARFTSSVASQVYQLGYGDTTLSSTQTAPTNPVYDFGNLAFTYVTNTVNVVNDYGIVVNIPAGKIPFVRSANPGTANHYVHVYGIEE